VLVLLRFDGRHSSDTPVRGIRWPALGARAHRGAQRYVSIRRSSSCGSACHVLRRGTRWLF